jgi:hypothetical protein
MCDIIYKIYFPLTGGSVNEMPIHGARRVMPGKRRVALLIETSPTYVRELAHGVAQYNREHGNWVIYLDRHAPDAPPAK